MKRLLTYIIIVLVLSACMGRDRYAAMRNRLDSINKLNRNSQPFTIADVQPYVDYFDRHGNGNDRLLAHYLLGRAYHDHGEAPMALECYQHALDCADTTAVDCNYAQLCRVYAQMSQIFYEQGLYRQQLKYDEMSVKYAWMAKDILAALMSYEQKYYAYKGLGQIDSAIQIIEDVAKQYNQYGYTAEAAVSLGSITRTLISRGDLGKASRESRGRFR